MVISLAKLLKTLEFFAPENIKSAANDAFCYQIVPSVAKFLIRGIKIKNSFRKTFILF